MSGYEIPVLIFDIIQEVRARNPDRPALIGVGGAQGSGKTHWCSLLEAANRPRFAQFSLDDVYFTRADRERLARELHPLFITRGPPGTHDMRLLNDTLAGLMRGEPTRLPRFDKAGDDRAPLETWPVFQGAAEAILIDGWCMGATAPPASPPINAVEREDGRGVWRAAIRAKLGDYQGAFSRFDALIYLQAPSWEVVRTWRGQQEKQLLGRPLTTAENAALDRFVMHYERVTRSMMVGGHTARRVVHLDEARNVVRVERRE